MLPTCIPVDSTPSHSITLPYHTIPYHTLPYIHWETRQALYSILRQTLHALHILNYMTLHYSTSHYIRPNYTTLHYTHYITYFPHIYIHTYLRTSTYTHTHTTTYLRISITCIRHVAYFRYISLPYITLHYIHTFQYIALQYSALHYIPVECFALHYITAHWIIVWVNYIYNISLSWKNAIWGDSPNPNHHSRVRQNSEVVVIVFHCITLHAYMNAPTSLP